MSYEHEAFWVVVGTAAPVLLVSSVVALGQVFDRAADEGAADEPTRVRIGDGMRLQPFLRAVVVSAASVLADFAALLLALIDLAATRDVVPLWLGITLLALAVVFLIATLWYALDARRRVSHPGPHRRRR